MNSTLTPLDQVFKLTTKVHTRGTPDEPWFAGHELATALGFSNPRAAIQEHVHEKDRKFYRPQTGDWYINESGLYSLAMQSDEAVAVAFQAWLCKRVLPGIFSTGSCTAPK